ncbi:MAG: integrase core domain-containing protein [Nitrososphaerales archaeon]
MKTSVTTGEVSLRWAKKADQRAKSSENEPISPNCYLLGLRRRLDYGPRRQKYHENAGNNHLKTVNIRSNGKSRFRALEIRPCRKDTGCSAAQAATFTRETKSRASRKHGAPDHLRSDSGSEFIARIVQDWFREHGIKSIYIAPGSPWQNGWIESFHARLRDECLNRELLLNLREARVVIEDFRRDYNQDRPHSKLGHLSPNEWIAQQSSSPDYARPAGLAASRLEQ